jgi:methionyl-tRNA formyltransferase
VVIAFGQKLSPTLLDGPFAINLHASLLPRWRGAAPIHHAIMAGDSETGVSVITLAQVMDAGLVLGQTRHPIGVDITTGELHDSLAQLGPALIGTVLDQHASGEVQGIAQDPELVCAAPRLSRSDAVLDLQGDADTQRCRINGLSPWPGCRVLVDGVEIRLLRAAPHDADAAAGGFLSKEGVLGLGTGAIRILEVQPAGGRAMPFETWANGRRFEAPRAVEVPV